MKISLVIVMMLVSLTMNVLVERRLRLRRRAADLSDCSAIVDAGSSGSRLYIFCKDASQYAEIAGLKNDVKLGEVIKDSTK